MTVAVVAVISAAFNAAYAKEAPTEAPTEVPIAEAGGAACCNAGFPFLTRSASDVCVVSD